LLVKETLGLPDIVDILGPRPFPMKASLLEYLEELRERINVEENQEVSTDKTSETQFNDEAVESASDLEENDEDKKDKEDDKESEEKPTSKKEDSDDKNSKKD